MPNCPVCDKKFHACGSCYLSHGYEYTYCSEECYLKSDEYKEESTPILSFLYSLNDEQREIFYKIVNDIDEDLLNFVIKEHKQLTGEIQEKTSEIIIEPQVQQKNITLKIINNGPLQHPSPEFKDDEYIDDEYIIEEIQSPQVTFEKITLKIIKD